MRSLWMNYSPFRGLWNNWTESPLSGSGPLRKPGFDRRWLRRRRAGRRWRLMWNARTATGGNRQGQIRRPLQGPQTHRGSTQKQRPQASRRRYVRENDIFVVAKLDRLARSVPDLMTILQALELKRVGVRILNLGMDTQTPTGKLMLTVLGAIAQFEREMISDRSLDGSGSPSLELALLREAELHPARPSCRSAFSPRLSGRTMGGMAPHRHPTN